MWGDYFTQFDCTIWSETGDEIDVYARYVRHSGSCQCFSNCDCYQDKGKVEARGFSFRAALVRNLHRQDGREHKMYARIEDAISQHYRESLRSQPIPTA